MSSGNLRVGVFIDTTGAQAGARKVRGNIEKELQKLGGISVKKLGKEFEGLSEKEFQNLKSLRDIKFRKGPISQAQSQTTIASLKNELENLSRLERIAQRTEEPAIGRPESKLKDLRTGRFIKQPRDRAGKIIQPETRMIDPEELTREREATIRRNERARADAIKEEEKAIVNRRNERRADIRAGLRRRKNIRRAAAGADNVALKVERDRTALSRKRGIDQSRMMMGAAGVMTGLTMPISGFTPLTIGFASMSGVGFGIAAAGAVAVRALFEIGAGLNKAQAKLLAAAEGLGAVSDKFKEQNFGLQARGIAQGSLVSAQSADRIQKWNTVIDKNLFGLSLLSEAWGQFRLDLSSIGQNFIGGLTSTPEESASTIKTISTLVGSTIGGLISPLGFIPGLVMGRRKGGELAQRGLESLSERGPALREAIANLQEDNFRSSVMKPEAFFDKISTSLLSARDKDDELRRLTIEELKKLLLQAEEAVKILKNQDGNTLSKFIDLHADFLGKLFRAPLTF